MVVARLDLSQPEVAAVPVFDLLGLDRDVITGPPSPLVEPQRAALTRQLKDHSDAPRPSRGGRSRRGRSAPTGVSLPPHTGRLVWKSRQGWTGGDPSEGQEVRYWVTEADHGGGKHKRHRQ